MSHLSGLAVSENTPAQLALQPAIRRSEGSLALSTPPALPTLRSQDRVELSGRNPAHTLKLVGNEEPAMRWDLIDRIREQIAAGSYDSPEKLEAALDRLAGSVDRLA
ncbi:MAG: flagellar biosynthesis anti-sigma factor FlgM [Phycisphaerales bacterium]|nr:flagellar biosynthesis anti-sigma factor FlgM [Phycisphaerales bacterium]